MRACGKYRTTGRRPLGRPGRRVQPAPGGISRYRGAVHSPGVVAATVLGLFLNRHNPPSLGLRQRGRLSGGVTALPEHDGDGFGIYWRSRWSRRILPPILVWSFQGCDRDIRERISRLCRPDGNCHRQRDLHSTILATFDQRRSFVIQPSQAVCHGPPIDNTRRNPI